MPLGSVTVREFAGAVETQLITAMGTGVDVRILDVWDADDIDTLRKGLGRGRQGVRISYDTRGTMDVEPGMSTSVTFEFGLIVTVLQSTLGSSLSRLGDGNSNDVSSLAKTAMSALESENLGILNTGGISCGSARYLGSGDSLQAMQFRVTGRSRESRS